MLVYVLLVMAAACARADVPIVIETESGVIEAVLYDKQAPVSVANFLKYVDAGYYTGGQFFRTVRSNPDNQPKTPVKIDVIQAEVRPEMARKGFGPIPLERTSATGLKHEAGSLSMPRTTPDSGESGFSICVAPQPQMDFGGKRNPDGQGFAVFGRVTAGMGVVRRIHRSPSGPNAADAPAVAAGDQLLAPPVRILGIRRK